MNPNDVAIIGASCRFPGANNLDEFWSVMINGEDMVVPVPSNRPYMTGTKELPAGYLKSPLDEFDAGFFNYSGREAPFVDPQLRLFLEVAWESLEHARIPPSTLRNTKTGLFLGVTVSHYRDLYEPTFVDNTRLYGYFGTNWSAFAGKLAHMLSLRGPCIISEAACASSGLAIHEAVTSLRSGKSEVALVGGVNVLLMRQLNLPDIMFSEACKTFDASADGFAPGECIGVVVLKLLEHALRDGDRPLAVIKGTSMNHNGKSRSLGTPNPVALVELMHDALQDAGRDTCDVSFVDAHGTGTRVGDPLEAESIVTVFKGTPRQEPLFISSTKTNFGHSLSSSGIASLLKIIMCIKYRQIPKHLHLKNMNPAIHFETIPGTVPAENVEWTKEDGGPLVAIFNNFGITGINVCVVVEEYAGVDNANAKGPTSGNDNKIPYSLITFSAKDPEALQNMALRYKQHLELNADLDVKDFAYSLMASRDMFPLRAALAVKDKADCIARLEAGNYETGDYITAGTSNADSLAFLFSGQGSSYFGMCKALYESCAVFRNSFDECAVLFEQNLNESLSAHLWENKNMYNSSSTRLRQPAQFAVQYCLYQVWTRAFQISPTFILGHSLGEFAAGVAAGILSLADGMKLICKRASLIDALRCPAGGMLAIGTSLQEVPGFIEEFKLLAGNKNGTSTSWIDVAAVNSDEQVTVSGHVDTLDAFQKFIASKSDPPKLKRLTTTHAFHSRDMRSIAEEFEDVLATIEFKSPTIRFISSVLGREIQADDVDADYWIQNLVDIVQFSDAAHVLQENGVKFYVEIGAQPVLLNLLHSPLPSDGALMLCPSVRSSDPYCWPTLLSSFAKLYTHWNGHLDMTHMSSHFKGRMIDLPHYAFTRQKYWINIPEPTSQLVVPLRTGNSALHPFIGSKLNLAGSSHPTYMNYLRADSVPWFRDHQVAGLVVAPAACFLEALLGIGYEHFGDSLLITDLIIRRALVITEENGSVQTAVKATHAQINAHAQGLQVNLYSQPKGEEQWTECFTGCVQGAPSSELGFNDRDFSALSSDTGMDTGPFYERFHVAGIEYRNEFRGITRCWETADEMICLLKNPALEGYMLHPIAFDLVIQTICYYATLSVSSLQMALPCKIPNFQWRGIDRTELAGEHFYIVVNKTTMEAGLFTKEGTHFCELQLMVLETNEAAFLSSVSPTIEPIPDFFEETWIAKQSAIAHEPNVQIFTAPSTWLIYYPFQAGTVASGLGLRITENGSRVVYLSGNQGDALKESSKDHFTIDPYSSFDFERLAATLDELGGVQGVVNLWGVGDSSLDLMTAAHLNVIKLGVKLLREPINRYCVVTQNAISAEDLKSGATTAFPVDADKSTLVGTLKTFINEYQDVSATGIDFDTKTSPDGMAMYIMEQLPKLGSETMILIRDGAKILVPRLVQFPIRSLPAPELSVATDSRFRMTAHAQVGSQEKEFRVDHIEPWNGVGASIRILAAGLNFRDVIVYKSALLDTRGFEVGCEFAGIIENIQTELSQQTGFVAGDRVCGLTNGKCFASHIVVENPQNLLRVPSWMNLNEAATLPVVFATVYQSLVSFAGLKEREKVLIHNGSGGVGLAAIQVAKMLGAVIYTTAGTATKRSYLKSVLGIQNVYDSRSTDFTNAILQDTNGTGVDVVLNTLTGPFFKEASMSTLKGPSPRFVELSKLDIWTVAEVQQLRPDVRYMVYDLDPGANDPEIIRTWVELGKLFAENALEGIPYECFPLHDLASALRKFHAGTHIGKFVIQISDKVTLLHSESTYLITGGLGGIGLQVADWMVQQGAGHVVLTGRNYPKDPEVLAKLKTLGDVVQVIPADISNYKSAKDLIFKISKELPPLRGIFHAAGVLSDAVLHNQTLDLFRVAFAPKVVGSWNLHNLTLGLNLDYFVLFSSIASIVGFSGQGPYTAANQFLDSFTKYRVGQLGLKGLAINYGGWLDVGFVANSAAAAQTATISKQRMGISFFPPKQGIAGLEKALRLGLVQITIANLDPRGLGDTMLPKLHAYVSKLTKSHQDENSGAGRRSAQTRGASDSSNELDKLSQDVRSTVEQQGMLDKLGLLVAKCFKMYAGMAGDAIVDRRESMFNYGMDSLMGMEIMNRLSKQLKVVISRKKFQECRTLADIETYLHEIIINNR